MSRLTGLSESEVQARQAQGLGNSSNSSSGRSYWDIISGNLFTFFNNLLFVIGVALIAMGRTNDALTSVALGLFNACISTLQEIRAKRQLDQITLVSHPAVTVVRASQDQTIEPSQLVQDDLIRIRAGDQVVVDGEMVGAGVLEIDESLLTGESELIKKQAGDPLLSGSFCVTGEGYYVAQKVGAASFANQLTATARQFNIIQTPLQKQISFVVRLVMLMVAIMSVIIMVAGLLEGFTALRLVQIAAVLSGQVPYGLFFMIVVAYALGASTIAKQGALVQQTNAIESLSNIDVLCTDKTGTLTANRLLFNDLYLLGQATRAEVQQALGDFVHSATVGNQTSEALATSLAGASLPPVDEVPFASVRKWSALAFDNAQRRGVYVMGALEMLKPHLITAATAVDGELMQQVQQWSDLGLRVLLFAYQPEQITLHNAAGQVELPALIPLALVSLSDELRPQVKETIEAFTELGINLKVISGDNPRTVAALAKQVGFPADVKLVSGPELAQMNPAEFDQAAIDATIFGRISPEQKERLVDAYLRQGKYVAMMGDGVNDVLSLKKASLGIAMQSGSSAARNVADMVLLNDSFAALKPAFYEGRRIVSGMSTALYLFLARVFTSTFVIIAVTMLGLSFPFDPAQVALTTFTVGIPAFFLTIWAKPQKLNPQLLSSLVRFVSPVAIITMLLGVGLYVLDYNTALKGLSNTERALPAQVVTTFESYTGVTVGSAGFGSAAATIAAQGSLSIFISCAAFLLILFLEPPTRFFLGWRTEVSADKRPALLAGLLFVLFQVIYRVPLLGNYFGILEKPETLFWEIMGLVVVWFFLIRSIWRAHLLERFLDLT